MIINTKNLKEGMILEEGIYTGKSNVYPLVLAGKPLTEFQITKIRENNIKTVKVKCATGVEETISEELQCSINESLKDFNIEKTINNARDLVNRILNSKALSYSLSKYYEQEDNWYKNAINVTLFAVATAKAYNESKSNVSEYLNLENVAMTALLHNLGNLCEDEEILKNIPTRDLNKAYFEGYDPEYYNSFNKNMIPMYSFAMLSEYPEISIVVKLASALVKENELGKGPLEVNANFMKSTTNASVLIAKLVNVASWYDLLIDKVITTGVSPLNVVEMMKQLQFSKEISSEFTSLLLKTIPLFSVGTIVNLSTGEIAKVVEINDNDMARPIVEVISSGEQIDLSQTTTIIISRVADIETIYSLRENLENIKRK